MKPHSIPEYTAPLSCSLRALAKASSLPFTVRKYADEIRRFDMAYLVRRYGEVEVAVLKREIIDKGDAPVRNQYATQTLRNYVHEIDQGIANAYLAQTPLDQSFPGLRGDLPVQDVLGGHLLTSINVWLGPQNTLSKLHYDIDHNYLIQAQGRKIVRLIGPADSVHCYRHGVSFYDGFSPVDSYSPDLEKYPAFGRVTLYEVTVGPGDLLFIPAYWWHDVRALEGSVSYNIWWVTRRMLGHAVGKELAHRAKAYLGLAPPLENKNSYLYGLLSR